MLQCALERPEDARLIGRGGQSRVRELFAFERVAGVLDAMLWEIEGTSARGHVRGVVESNDSRG
jgi:hypothetical protein